MKRWNGWGDSNRDYHLPTSAESYLKALIGPGKPRPDAHLKDVVASVPDSRLPQHPLISADPLVRLAHARGQSLPDWVALRSGQIDVFPDAVAFPTTDEQVRQLLAFCRETGAKLIPYGGGTSVVGHINPLPGARPVLTVDMSRMNRLIDLDETSHLAAFEAGVSGPELEIQLKAHGYTLGHFPQSFEYSTLGGWIATRSSGQQSFHFGRIEDHFAGGHVETPLGPLDLPPFPASAAGPDLRQMVLGSEGRLGLITRATVRIRPIAAEESFHAVVFRDWQSGINAVRAVVQAGVAVSMLRLSDPVETDTNLRLSGKDRLVGLATRALSAFGYRDSRSMLILGVTGDKHSNELARKQVNSLIKAHGGLLIGKTIGDLWRKNRFTTPYLRNTLWEMGYAIDTFETALSWNKVPDAAAAMTAAARDGLQDDGERIHAFTHLSHVYRDGASVYTTYVFRRGASPDETLTRWHKLKRATSGVVVAHGGTISHQHGVGVDHAPYLSAEKGELGIAMLKNSFNYFDPDNMLNPGKLTL
ncbi:MAG: FAD-binding oxidoreductase [Anaerolineae bacterium]|nr:FAD-binding oxidoreductase [Anaerolineae bacterium]